MTRGGEGEFVKCVKSHLGSIQGLVNIAVVRDKEKDVVIGINLIFQGNGQ